MAPSKVPIYARRKCPWGAKWGEAVTAVVQLKPGESVAEDELRSFCKARDSFQ